MREKNKLLLSILKIRLHVRLHNGNISDHANLSYMCLNFKNQKNCNI